MIVFLVFETLKKGVLESFRDGTKAPQFPITRQISEAYQLGSVELLDAEEWQNFIREVASHEDVTPSDIKFLRDSKDIFEGNFFSEIFN